MIGRIQSRSAFARIRAEGHHVRFGLLSCTMVVDSTLPHPHVGYALTRSFGNAVRRNRLRRQLRELVKGRAERMQPGLYVFGASPRAAGRDAGKLGRDLDGLLARLEEAGRAG
ncbi:MAG: ribonuclease P protein component [Ilumatobacteraceae bacterium]